MWFQLKIEECPTEQIEAISEVLEEHGALSIMLSDKNDNPVLEPAPGETPLWPEVVMQVLFAQAHEAQYIKELFEASKPHLTISIEILADKDWERAWMDDFKPQQFGKKLWICPSWTTPPEPEAINLMLDPGLAFGTGTHPTTFLCLTWLEQANLQDKIMIDFGCGSGILSIAALKLGAHHAYAVDIDEQALIATKNNSLTNHINPDQLTITQPHSLDQSVEFIIANILLGPLMSLKDRFAELLLPGGLLVVSGILKEQTQSLIDTYKNTFTLKDSQSKEEWSLLVFEKNP